MSSGICEFGSLEDLGNLETVRFSKLVNSEKWKIENYDFGKLEVASSLNLRMLGVQVSWDL